MSEQTPRAQKPKPDPEDVIGVSCPWCGCGHAPVLETRKYPGGLTRRHRECRNCERRFITNERVQGA